MVSWSVAQASVRAVLRPSKMNGQPGMVGSAWFVGAYCLAKHAFEGVGLKPWSARAWLRRESERGSDGREKVKRQPGWFGRACLEKQRRRSDVAWFHNGMASLENGMFKGRGR